MHWIQPQSMLEKNNKKFKENNLSKRSLTPDELGDRGEAAFRSILHPSITVNQSHPDKRGWDFLVEFKPPESLTPHKKFFIQVKTIWDDNTAVRGKLSSIKMIALNELPSGILVVKISSAETVSSYHYIELKGLALDHILQRLTKEEFDGNTELNNSEMSFSVAKYGVELDQTTYPLSDFLDGLFDNQSDYISEKNRQISESGFTGGKVHFSIKNDGTDFLAALARISLGLDTFTPAGFDAFRVRFGFDLPDHAMNKSDPKNVEMRIGPSDPTPTKIRVESRTLQEFVELSGNLHNGFFDIPGQTQRPFMFRGETIEFVVLNPDDFVVKIDCFPADESREFDPYELEKYSKFRMILNESDCKLTFFNEANQFASFTLSDHINPIDNEYYGRIVFSSYALGRLNDLIDNFNLTVSVADIFSNSSDIRNLIRHTGFKTNGGAFKYSQIDPKELSLESPTSGMVLEVIKIGDDCFAIKSFYPNVKIDNDSIQFDFEGIEILSASYLGKIGDQRQDTKEAYDNFVKLNRPEGFDGVAIIFESKDYQYMCLET